LTKAGTGVLRSNGVKMVATGGGAKKDGGKEQGAQPILSFVSLGDPTKSPGKDRVECSDLRGSAPGTVGGKGSKSGRKKRSGTKLAR